MIATRFGFSFGATRGLDSRPEHVKEVAEASLKGPKANAIDLFYPHRVDPNVPIEGARLPEDILRMTGR